MAIIRKTLYGARFSGKFLNNRNKNEFHIHTYIRKSWCDDTMSGEYYLESDPRKIYRITEYLEIVDTYYHLNADEEQRVQDLAEENYYGQSESTFYYGEERELESYVDDARAKLFGWIEYPNKVFHDDYEAKGFLRELITKEFTRANDSNDRTIKMYSDDNQKVNDSFDKVTKDSIIVEEPIVGTKFYKYISSVGIFEYELTEIIEMNDLKLYKTVCKACNHSAPCEVIISKVYNDTYSLVKVCDEENQHKFYHLDATHFYTSKKAAYQDYKNKIIDYNDRVLGNLKQVKDIYELVINLENS